MRFIISLLSLSISFAAIPAGYYDPADGLIGNDLRLALHNIIDGHTQKTYDDLWTAFATTDIRSSLSSDYIWCMYTELEFHHDEDQQGNITSDVYTTYNREHSWPKSWANNTYPHYTDLYHLYPTQAYANTYRNNNPYGEVGSSVIYTTENGSKLGAARTGLGYSGTVFEPIDEYKGDLARTYFYVSTRYYTEDAAWGTSDMTNKCELEDWAVSMLLNWHNDDPVSQKELDRVEAVYAIQGNRNPFIDHPEYVADIWDAPAASFGAPTAQSASSILSDGFTANWSSVSEATGYKLYVSLNSDFSSYISGYGPYDAGNTQSKVISGLASSTLYYYRVVAYKVGEESGNSNIVTVETTAPVGAVDSTKIFISEYIEGSSSNKALEIFNNTGSAIDLSKITLKLYSNGAATPSSTLILSGTLLNNSVYVIANSASNASILAEADLYNNGVINFNGNDALEMYYSDILIDVFGIAGTDPGTSWSVAGNSSATVNHTLVRKSSVTQGNTNWSSSAGTTTENSEWIIYSQDESSYLGAHSVDESPTPITLSSFSAIANNGVVELSWQTASETNNAAFILYRNGEALARIEGAGTTSEMQDYVYIDNTVIPNVSYTYVLADVDYSHKETKYVNNSVSITITGDIKVADYKVGKAYPNPFNPKMLCKLYFSTGSTTIANVYNSQGILVDQLFNGYLEAGTHELSWDASNMPSGVYIMSVQANGFFNAQKVVLMK